MDLGLVLVLVARDDAMTTFLGVCRVARVLIWPRLPLGESAVLLDFADASPSTQMSYFSLQYY